MVHYPRAGGVEDGFFTYCKRFEHRLFYSACRIGEMIIAFTLAAALQPRSHLPKSNQWRDMDSLQAFFFFFAGAFSKPRTFSPEFH